MIRKAILIDSYCLQHRWPFGSAMSGSNLVRAGLEVRVRLEGSVYAFAAADQRGFRVGRKYVATVYMNGSVASDRGRVARFVELIVFHHASAGCSTCKFQGGCRQVAGGDEPVFTAFTRRLRASRAFLDFPGPRDASSDVRSISIHVTGIKPGTGLSAWRSICQATSGVD